MQPPNFRHTKRLPSNRRSASAAPAISIIGTFLLFLSAISTCGCKKEEPITTKVETPRPVAVASLEIRQPLKGLRVMGSVRSWKEQDISFEVSGTMSLIVEDGSYLSGRWVENGEVRIQGDPLAEIDPEAYTISRDTAKANLDVAKKRLAAARIQYDKVLPANIRAAEADRDRALAEHTRTEEAFSRNAVSEVEVIRTAASRDATAAALEQARASREAQAAEIEALEASEKQWEEQLRAAQYDLDHCQVFAPFAGEVSEVYVEAGGFVQKGQAVAHLVMMDPVEIDIALSQEMADTITTNQQVILRIPGEEKTFSGGVYEKATVADPSTRTVRVSLITRNWRLLGNLDPEDPRREFPRISMHMYLTRLRHDDPKSPHFVEARRALRQAEDGSYFVWADPRYSLGDPLPDELVLTVKKYPVIPGDQLVNFQGLYLFRVLEEIGDLAPEALIAMDVPEGTSNGAQLVVAQESWRLRPGQLVEVLLTDDPPAPGLYLPMSSILPIGDDEGEIFVADEGKARKMRVRLFDNVEDLFRIEAMSESEKQWLVPGAKAVLDPVHFLRDGDPIRIVEEVEQQP